MTLDIIEKLYRANDVYISKDDLRAQQFRLDYQRGAMTDLRILTYFSMLAYEQQCILFKQYEQISRKATDCQNLLGAWMNSDRRRFK